MSSEIWTDPKPLPSGLGVVKVLTPDMLPKPVRPWLVDIAERSQAPLEYPVVPAIISAAATIGRKVGICPKQRDNWLVIPNMWGAIIGPPGVLKSPIMRQGFEPFQLLIKRDRAQYLAELHEWKGAKKKPNDWNDDDKPIMHRRMTNDATVEKVGDLLSNNPHGIVLYRDELTGFFTQFTKQGHETDRAFYLEAWAGTSDYTYDRVGRGTIYIPAACVSVLGSMTPSALNMFENVVTSGAGDDGLLQRFQLIVWPDVLDWKGTLDRNPNSHAYAVACRIFRGLDTLNLKTIPVETKAASIPFLRLESDAQTLFYDYFDTLEIRVRSGASSPMISHLSKYRSLVPSLALVFHLINVVGGESRTLVTLSAMKMALAWADYLESHARRVYSKIASNDQNLAARLVVEAIRAGDLTDRFTAREIYSKDWSGLTDPDEVEGALALLKDLGYVQSKKIKTGGRPKIIYLVNPKMKAISKRGT